MLHKGTQKNNKSQIINPKCRNRVSNIYICEGIYMDKYASLFVESPPIAQGDTKIRSLK
jgi:hypothetical protein